MADYITQTSGSYGTVVQPNAPNAAPTTTTANTTTRVYDHTNGQQGREISQSDESWAADPRNPSGRNPYWMQASSPQFRQWEETHRRYVPGGDLNPDTLNTLSEEQQQRLDEQRRFEERRKMLTGLLGDLPRQAPQAGQTTLGAIERFGGAQLDTAQQAEWRARQQVLADLLGDRAAGRGGPSVAEQQLRMTTDRTLAQAMALQAGQRGAASSGLARADLANRAMETNQDANAQAAVLRAQEAQAAEQLLAQVAGQSRATDVDIAGQNAGFTQQAGLANMGAANQRTLAQGQMDQERELQNIKFRLEQAGLDDTQTRALAQLLAGGDEFQVTSDISRDSLTLEQQKRLDALDANKQSEFWKWVGAGLSVVSALARVGA